MLFRSFVLNGDGSLLVRYQYSFAEENAELLGAANRIVERWQDLPWRQAPRWFADEAAVRTHFSAPGVRLQGFESSAAGGRRHVAFSVFAERGAAAINAGVFGAFRLERLPDGALELSAEMPEVPADAAPPAPALTEALCDDLHLRLTMQVPTPITQTTAPRTDRRTAIWDFDPAKDTAFLAGLPRIACAFEARHLEWASSVPPAGDSKP